MTVPEYLRELASLEESGGCDLGVETLREIADRYEKMVDVMTSIRNAMDHEEMREMVPSTSNCIVELLGATLAATRAPLGKKEKTDAEPA